MSFLFHNFVQQHRNRTFFHAVAGIQLTNFNKKRYEQGHASYHIPKDRVFGIHHFKGPVRKGQAVPDIGKDNRTDNEGG